MNFTFTAQFTYEDLACVQYIYVYLVFVGLGTVRTLVHADLGVGLYVSLEVGDLEEALGTQTALVDPVRNLRVTPHVDLVQSTQEIDLISKNLPKEDIAICLCV